VDFLDPHFHKPRGDGKLSGRFTDEEVKKAVHDRDPANAKYIGPWDWEFEMEADELQSFWGTDHTPGDAEYLRMDCLKYVSSRQGLVRAMFRSDLMDEDTLQAELRKWSPYHMLDKSYPPTFFLHGTADEAVPVEQSYRMEAKLKDMGVHTGSAYKEGGAHCFDQNYEVRAILAER